MKRHSWKKKIKEKIEIKRKIGNNNSISYIVTEAKECVNCGLRKGHLKQKDIHRYRYSYPRLAYFTNSGEFIDFEKLPFSCSGIKFIFDEEDFFID